MFFFNHKECTHDQFGYDSLYEMYCTQCCEIISCNTEIPEIDSVRDMIVDNYQRKEHICECGKILKDDYLLGDKTSYLEKHENGALHKRWLKDIADGKRFSGNLTNDVINISDTFIFKSKRSKRKL